MAWSALNNTMVDPVKTRPIHTGKVCERLIEFRANGTLCDYVMVAGDERISVHKVIMAACSDYFYAMVTSDMKEKAENLVTLDVIDGKGLRAVVDFAYSGIVSIELDNVSSILQAASYLQVQDLVEQCEAYVANNIRLDNCVLLTPLIELYGIGEKCPHIANFIFDNFCDIPSEHCNTLSLEQFIAVLSDDRLKLRSETCLVLMVKDWVTSNIGHLFDRPSEEIIPEEEPWVTFTLLMSEIRWCLMSEDDLNNIDWEVQSVMDAIPTCRELVHEAKRYHLDIYRQPLMQNPRSRVRCDSKQVVQMSHQVLQTFSITSPMIHTYDIRKRPADNIINRNAVSFNNFLFVCGGTDKGISSSACVRYDPRFNKWQDVASMNVARHEFVIVAHGNALYVIGGYISDKHHETEKMITGTSSACETYDIKTNTWNIIPEYTSGIIGHAGCVVGGEIYISGGCQSYKGECQSNLLRYNVPAHEWRPCAAMTHRRSGHIMETIGEAIYVIGGDVGTIERYSIEANQWTNCKKTICINVSGSFVRNGKIFALGNDLDRALNLLMTFSEECDNVIYDEINCGTCTHGLGGWNGSAVLSIPFHMETYDAYRLIGHVSDRAYSPDLHSGYDYYDYYDDYSDVYDNVDNDDFWERWYAGSRHDPLYE